MLLKIQLLFLLFVTQSLSDDHQIIVKLDPGEIIKTLASESSMKYLQKLADVFAKKAAEKFVDEIKNKEYEYLSNDHRNHEKVQKAVLDEDKAFALLQKPSPDGDNLEYDTLDLTREEETTKKSIPVIGLMKVNGKYFDSQAVDTGIVMKLRAFVKPQCV
ncbi:uncharacterized protein LOC123692605 [Colias croceus]|uniref:uncharacterized protein LOC123692605 n=1 Tax=Colias crocea TaxID=72248 RepID=UPI001E27AAFA|nr:uncharacterized protein LOC123692605 [Colias croceus]